MFSWANAKKPIITLSPMEGITDSAFRRICKEQGAEVVYTEVIHVDSIIFAFDAIKHMAHFLPEERPLIIQIKGKVPENFAKAVKIINTLKPDGIDINCGCPARKVVQNGSGVGLLRTPKLLKEIIQTVVANTDLPVSVKTRTGIDGTSILEILEEIEIEKLGIASLTIHGRTKEVPFTGEIDTETIRKVKEKYAAFFPVLANGGIKNRADIARVLAATKADGVMIARGALGNPWIFRDPEYTPTTQERIETMLKHTHYTIADKGERLAMLEMRKHFGWYIKGFPNASDLRKQLMQTKTFAEVQAILAQQNT